MTGCYWVSSDIPKPLKKDYVVAPERASDQTMKKTRTAWQVENPNLQLDTSQILRNSNEDCPFAIRYHTPSQPYDEAGLFHLWHRIFWVDAACASYAGWHLPGFVQMQRWKLCKSDYWHFPNYIPTYSFFLIPRNVFLAKPIQRSPTNNSKCPGSWFELTFKYNNCCKL